MGTATTKKPSAAKSSVSATLASMASAPIGDSASAPVEAPFDWASLPPAEVVVYSRNTATVRDLEKETPQAVKDRVLEAFSETLANVDLSKGRPRGWWKKQRCPSEATAALFLKAARRYASFRGYVFKGKVVPNDLTVVSFSVSPKRTA